MLSECVKLTAVPFGTGANAGRSIKLTWELCECCNFTRIKLLRMNNPAQFIGVPPNYFNTSQWVSNGKHFTLTPNGFPYPFPPPAIANQVWTSFEELFDLEVGEHDQWYLGPSADPPPFGVFYIKNVDGLILLAQCCETNTWIMSKVSVITFFPGPWLFADVASGILGYSSSEPPV